MHILCNKIKENRVCVCVFNIYVAPEITLLCPTTHSISQLMHKVIQELFKPSHSNAKSHSTVIQKQFTLN